MYWRHIITHNNNLLVQNNFNSLNLLLTSQSFRKYIVFLWVTKMLFWKRTYKYKYRPLGNEYKMHTLKL
jgi:hypothetical protein